jgi:hypothetical protein
MNSQLVAILASIAAAQARIAGYVAENASAASINAEVHVPYDGQAFFIEADLLDQLSIDARNS